MGKSGTRYLNMSVENKPLRLLFVGDIFPADEDISKGFGILSKTKDNKKRWTDNIQAVMGQADYIVGNLEGPLLRHPEDKTFCGSPLFAEVLKDAGVNILNIANNHITEHGAEGVDQTLSILKEQGILAIGTVQNDSPEFVTIQENDTKICLAGFCDNRICTMGKSECYAGLDARTVTETLERIKSTKPDIIVFVFHWGNEYVSFPSLEQRQLAYNLIDNGVHLIVGHHSHVIQPYEQYKNGHIIYSLGNFCFNDVPSRSLEKGMVAEVTIGDRQILDLNFKGLLVQDMSYRDDLVKPMPDALFKKSFTRTNHQYARLCRQQDHTYLGHYAKTVKRNHRIEMMKMCVEFSIKALNPWNRYRRMLVSNIRQYLKAKYNN